MANEVVMLGGDGLEDIEYEILKDTYGEKEAKKLLKDSDTLEELDPELQEIVDGTPALV